MDVPKRLSTRNVLLIVGAVVGVVVSIVQNGLRPTESDESVFRALQRVSLKTNQLLPMLIDANTRMDGTFPLTGRKICFKYTLLNLKEMPDPKEFSAAVRPILINTYKTSKSSAELRKLGVTMVCIYSDEAGNEIAQIKITPEDAK